MSAKLVPTLADRGCRVVSATPNLKPQNINKNLIAKMQIGKLNKKDTFVINILLDVRRTNRGPASAASSHWCCSLI
jgi:hypothetical protein